MWILTSHTNPTLWSVTSHTAPLNKYMHTHNGLACKVQGLHNAANTIAHSHCLAFTCNSLHRAKRTHRGPDFQKTSCCWPFFSLSRLKNRHIFKNGQHKKFWTKRLLQNGQKNPNGQTKNCTANQLEIWPQNGQSGNPVWQAHTRFFVDLQDHAAKNKSILPATLGQKPTCTIHFLRRKPYFCVNVFQ